MSPPQSVLLFHDNISRIVLVLAHYSSLLVRTLPGVRTGKSTTSWTVQQPTKVKAWPAMMLLFLLHLTMVCAITCYIWLWLMLPHNMFDCGLCYHPPHLNVACATIHQIWLWLVLLVSTFSPWAVLHLPHLVVACATTRHIWLWCALLASMLYHGLGLHSPHLVVAPATVHISTTTRQSSTLGFIPE